MKPARLAVALVVGLLLMFPSVVAIADEAEQGRVQQLRTRNPDARLQDSEWLRAHPDVAADTLGNREWLNQNPDLAKQFYKDRAWLANNPAAAKALYSNRAW